MGICRWANVTFFQRWREILVAKNLKMWRRFFRDVTLRHRWGLYVVPDVSSQHSGLIVEGFRGTSYPWWWDHYPVSKRREPNTLWHIVTSQKNWYLINTAAKTLKLANFKDDRAVKRIVNRAMSDNVGHRLLPIGYGKYLSWSGSMWKSGGTQSFKFEWFFLWV